MNRDAVFITPHYADHPRAADYLLEAVHAVQAQTDPTWRLVIIDDKSPDESARQQLAALRARDPQRIHCIFMPERVRQGVCRNVGVSWAHSIGSQFVLFNDADDVSNPHRLQRVRAAFEGDADAGLVYSSFEVVDERCRRVDRDALAEPIRQILEALTPNPPRGYDVWKRLSGDTGYANLTSATAVRTSVALEYPFFCMTAEDSNAWYRMSGGGVKFCFIETALTKYRIPTYVKGSQDRQRVGDAYPFGKMIAEFSGFFAAVEQAIARGEIDNRESLALERDFFMRLSRTLRAEGADRLAEQVMNRARAIACGSN